MLINLIFGLLLLFHFFSFTKKTFQFNNACFIHYFFFSFKIAYYINLVRSKDKNKQTMCSVYLVIAII